MLYFFSPLFKSFIVLILILNADARELIKIAFSNLLNTSLLHTHAKGGCTLYSFSQFILRDLIYNAIDPETRKYGV